MTDFLLYWSLFAVSLFNTVLLCWLGLTILLNAQRRDWGLWLAGVGLIGGSAFFALHTAMLDYPLQSLIYGVQLWWYAFLIPVIALPLVWYGLMLWYAGFWEGESALRRRQRWGLALCAGLVVLLGVLVVQANPSSPQLEMERMMDDQTWPRPAFFGVPLLMVVYPLYIVGCMSLALDALGRPGPTARMMGDLARRRARPWLMAASLVQLLSSLLIAVVLGWMVLNVRRSGPMTVYSELAYIGDWLDLMLGTLTAISIVLLGQAIVSYEIFTGTTLPRNGLQRQWRTAVLLAATFGIVMGLTMGIEWRPVYGLILATFFISTFLALMSWRSFHDRELAMANLRPFIASQNLYEHLLMRAPEEGSNNIPPRQNEPLRALCEDVLDATVAYLIPSGPLAPLMPSIAFPPQKTLPTTAQAASLLSELGETHCLPVDAAQWNGAAWAVPLTGSRGPIGVLLLGEKRGGGLYSAEEIEIARAAGERLIDAGAGAALAERLMNLQRQRLMESQVVDRRARRVLHDDILPRLHATMLSLGPDNQDALEQLTAAHREIADLLRAMPSAVLPEVHQQGVLDALRQVVEEEMGAAFDAVHWQISQPAEQAAANLPALTAEVLFYAARETIRNAARHGRGRQSEKRPLQLWITAEDKNGLTLVIEDDGAGLSESTAAGSTPGGSGQGLSLHSTMMAVAGGSLAIENSAGGSGTRVELKAPPAEFQHGGVLL